MLAQEIRLFLVGVSVSFHGRMVERAPDTHAPVLSRPAREAILPRRSVRACRRLPCMTAGIMLSARRLGRALTVRPLAPRQIPSEAFAWRTQVQIKRTSRTRSTAAQQAVKTSLRARAKFREAADARPRRGHHGHAHGLAVTSHGASRRPPQEPGRPPKSRPSPIRCAYCRTQP